MVKIANAETIDFKGFENGKITILTCVAFLKVGAYDEKKSILGHACESGLFAEIGKNLM